MDSDGWFELSFLALVGLAYSTYLLMVIFFRGNKDTIGYSFYSSFSILGIVGRTYELVVQIRDPDSVDTTVFAIVSTFAYFFIDLALISFIFPLIQMNEAVPIYKRNIRIRRAITWIIPISMVALLIQLILAVKFGYHVSATFGNAFAVAVLTGIVIYSRGDRRAFRWCLFLYLLVLLKSAAVYVYTTKTVYKYFSKHAEVSFFIVCVYLVFELLPLFLILKFYKRIPQPVDIAYILSDSTTQG